ncbi:hypothetical protein V6N12_064157 [Hibiscus sabdariffa]|uniref:Protein PGR n=1 Tax=Hibiscus sabdariffa TaxID=183260 RepID=A0ABR2G5B5_9ROSI
MENALIQPLIAVLISSLIAIRSYRRKSLDLSGALAGFLVMSIHFAVGYRFGAMLLAFFFSSSKLTKVGEDKKRRVDADFKEGGQRNWIQVFSNSGIAAVLSVAIGNLTGWEDKCLESKDSVLITALIGGIIGHYSCCNGDTWSSELGVLSDDQPRLITTFKPVRRGTNGGVTKTGLLAALAAGTVVGLTFVLVGFFTTRCSDGMAMKQLLVIPLSAVAGLLGSLIDSLLGATLQFSGFCSVRNKVVGKPGPTVRKISGLGFLDNNAVNLVSILLTTLLTSIASRKKMEKTLIQPSVAVLISSSIAIIYYRRKSLDLYGALVLFLAMTIHFAVGYRFGAMLLIFFFTSSKLIEDGEEKKRRMEAGLKDGRPITCAIPQFLHFRKRVLLNSGVAAVLSVAVGCLTGWEDKCLDSNESVLITRLIGGIIGHYACCNGDSWSSEIGILSSERPCSDILGSRHSIVCYAEHMIDGSDVCNLYSVTIDEVGVAFLDCFASLLQRVRKGTNGGVTEIGYLSASAAGTVVSQTFALVGLHTTSCFDRMGMKELLVVPVSTVAGLLGSVIRSLLGATLQFSGFCLVRKKVVEKPGPTVRRISGRNYLDNDAVNLISILLTTLITSTACVYIF